MPRPSLFGSRLAEVRGIRGLTQQQLSDAAGVPAAVISHFETGVRSSASADNLVKLADALRVSVDYLLGRTDDMTPAGGTMRDARAKLSDDEIKTLDLLAETFLARRAKPDKPRGE
jgi:transcriptional regulator with XRE-family HTH domain